MKKLIILIPFLFAFTYPDRPVTRVNDYANILTTQQHDQLVDQLKNIETATKAQVAVAIFPTIEENSIEEIGHTLATKWKLGSKESNDGILLVLALKEHKMRIEVGYGLEQTLTDAIANGILRNSMRPHLRSNNMFAAIQAFGVDVNKVLTKTVEAPIVATSTAKPQTNDATMGFGILGALLGLFGFGWWMKRRKDVINGDSALGNSFSVSDVQLADLTSYADLISYVEPKSSSKSKKSTKKASHTSDDDSYTPSRSSRSSSSYSSSSSSSSDSSDSGSSWGSGSDSGFSGGGGDFGGGGSSSDW